MSHRALAFETAKRYTGDGGHNRLEDVPDDAFVGPIVAAKRYDPMRQLPPDFPPTPFHPHVHMPSSIVLTPLSNYKYYNNYKNYLKLRPAIGRFRG